ncbi:MAG: diacylglycerol kinase family lipid kinase [Eggerthellaceae bacterium]|nr:diacylglycerol kinase family lipid kinase [Eggerthellaceae bacterium]
MTTTLGKTLIIANPTAQNGNGEKAAQIAETRLREHLGQEELTVTLTNAPCHAKALAAASIGFDTVVALGGDGVIHETVNGLMRIPAQQRPAFGVLPVGSGNDYASTLGRSLDIEESVKQLLEAAPKPFDLGWCSGEYFVETLSFGLDAAIAIDTVRRRIETGKTGNALYFESGIDMLLHNRKNYDYTLQCGEGAQASGQMMLFAVQVGQTYGGGFKICPDAVTDDGLFDLCIAHAPIGLVKALMIFLLAKNAHHTGFKEFEFIRTDALRLSFPGLVPPAQVDGEAFTAEEFDIRCMQKALQVLV